MKTYTANPLDPQALTRPPKRGNSKAYFTPYSDVLKRNGFGGIRVRKVTLHGGFTCPNLDGTKGRGGCIYCDNRSFSPVAGKHGIPVKQQLQDGMNYARIHFQARKFIAYFQPFSGTYAPLARLRELYSQALDHHDVIGLSVGTRPDCVTTELAYFLEELSKKTYVTLELGLQTSFDETLLRINRRHTFSDFSTTMDLCRDRGFEVCVHIILGLPGETPEHFRATARILNRWSYHSIKIHPLHVVKNTALAANFIRGEYKPMELEEYVEGLVDFLENVPPQVGVQRFTGDARGDLLIAPLWCREKNSIRKAMESEFERKASCQGFELLGKKHRLL